jgi:hypothetical protein
MVRCPGFRRRGALTCINVADEADWPATTDAFRALGSEQAQQR